MNIPPEQYDNNSLYDKEFFENQINWSINSAKIILPIVLGVLPKINSAVDFGCGTGTWLSELKNLGVSEIQGFDGSWAEKSLVIPSECFTAIEFDKEFIKTKKYDLAISLEVAEHLNEQSSRKFIEMLTNASDIILFSAAIPFQGGTNHINEQWQSYWYNIFNEYGYTGTSYLRKKFIKNKKISFFYKQNIILYVKREMLKLVNIPKKYFDNEKIDFVHPSNILYWKVYNSISLIELYKLVLKRTIKMILGEKLSKNIRVLTKRNFGE